MRLKNLALISSAFLALAGCKSEYGVEALKPSSSVDPNNGSRDVVPSLTEYMDITLSGTSVNEAGDQLMLTIQPKSTPNGKISLAIGQSADSKAGEIAFDHSTIEFDVTNWNFAQVVTVTGLADNVEDPDQIIPLFIDASGSTDPIVKAVSKFTAEITNFNLSPISNFLSIQVTGSELSERGDDHVTLTFQPINQPAGVVTVKITRSIEGKIEFDTWLLTFGPDDWGPKTITATAVQDDIDDSDVVVKVTASARTSEDQAFKKSDNYSTNITIHSAPKIPTVSQITGEGWNFTSGGAGNGTFIYAFDGDTIQASSSTTTTSPLKPSLTAGIHIVHIAELDSHGNRSKIVDSAVLIGSPIIPKSQTGDISAPAEATLLRNIPIVLDGDVIPGEAGKTVNISWTLVSQPDGSNITLGAGLTPGSPTFTPDIPGTYTFQRKIIYQGFEFTHTISLIVEGFGVATYVSSSNTGDHSCAIAGGGKVYCWGANDSYQLGIDFSHGGTDSHNHTNSLRPERAGTLTDATSLALGGAHSCALLSGGTVSCWGDHGKLQLGPNYTSGSKTAVAQDVGLTTVAAIAAGKEHTCALMNDKTIKCWGAGSQGELGNGANADSATPVAVTGISTANELACGNGFCCAWLVNKTAKCWGRGDLGQLGNGATANQSTPVAVAGISDASHIGAGDSHACVINSDRATSCWGLGTTGQLGKTDNLTSQSSPVRVTGY